MSLKVKAEGAPPKKKYLKTYKSEWEWHRPWLTCRKGDAYCTICGKTLVSERFNIERHESSNLHAKRMKLHGGIVPEPVGKVLKMPVAREASPTYLYADYLSDVGDKGKEDEFDEEAEFLDETESAVNSNGKIQYTQLETTANFLEEYAQDDTLIYGKVWAAEFKELNKEQRIYAKRAIDEVLYQGRLDNLTSRSWNIPIQNDLLERMQDSIIVEDQS